MKKKFLFILAFFILLLFFILINNSKASFEYIDFYTKQEVSLPDLPDSCSEYFFITNGWRYNCEPYRICNI